MITYILESLAFQLVFLLTYDLFLKKETFFQWNRVYLLGTFVLSLILPWVKIEALKTTMPQELGTTTVFLTQLEGVVLGPGANEASFLASIPWPYWVLGAGSFLATVWFAYKLIQIGRLRRKSSVQRFEDFTKITVPQSSTAFSFFRNIFLGADIKKEKEDNILAHELVHVKQFHSLDLIFFELARILLWFNPLVYLYQKRIAELHEFIADAQAVKQNKAAHFDMLLSEAFHTQNISFVNQFFKTSLIKKRIVMLQKQKSKAVWQLKYVVMLPLVLGMLVYTSCEPEPNPSEDDFIRATGKANEMSNDEIYNRLKELSESGKDWEFNLIKKNGSYIQYRKSNNGSYIKFDGIEGVIYGTMAIISKSNEEKLGTVSGRDIKGVMVPFDFIEKVPVFPGCEDATDTRECFMEKMKEHIRKHFKYPEEAQVNGIQGRVNTIFIIDAEGNVVDIKMRGPSPILEAEAQRILELLPRMQPGTQKGIAVRVPFSIPISFRLQ